MADEHYLSFEELREMALRLPLHERRELGEDLLQSAEGEDEDEDPAVVQAAWADEIKRRVEEFDAGTAESSPMADVFDRVRARLKRISDAEAQLR
jgi:putative addiction module component (TIGR02574 family)